MKQICILLCVTAALSITGCKSSKLNETGNRADEQVRACDGVKATIVDYSHLDGCRWMLQTDHKKEEKLMPINLDAFDLEPENEIEVIVDFEFHDMPNTCMAGKTVRILCIERSN